METTITAIQPDHAHRWLIGEPNGPVSNGICKICKARIHIRYAVDIPSNLATIRIPDDILST